MPSGVRELERLGARGFSSQPFRGIRYLQDGCAMEARFRGGDGAGIRRTELVRALRDRALALGVELRVAKVESAQASVDRVSIAIGGGSLEARLLVAADGLHSPLRRAAGLDRPASRAPGRFGIRRHFSLPPWSDLVEVHWQPGVEAYVTPVGPRSVNVAFLSSRGESFDELMAHFPALQSRVAGAPPESEARGAGPLLQRVHARHAQRLALIGDAAGYVDAITGQGLSLAFVAARILAGALPRDLAGDLQPALRAYDRALRSHWLRYALPAQALVSLARRPRLRASALRTAAALPRIFSLLVNTIG
jgi:flavin-dependent dehydrogenase